MKFGCAYSFVEAPTNHSGNDSSGSTSYSRHEHFFHQMLLVFVPGTFLRVLTTSIILVQLSLESWKKKENHRAGPTGSTSEAAAAAVEKQVFGPILIHAGAKDMPPCFVLRQRPVSYTHLRAHETRHDLVCRLLLEKKKRRQHSA